MAHRFTVFTKPWRADTLDQLADRVAAMGFDGVELTVRPGYQVEPETAERELRAAVALLADRGLCVPSVAGPREPNVVRACGAAGVPILRVFEQIDRAAGFDASIDRLRRDYDDLAPVLRESGVILGIQNHSGYCPGSAAAMRLLLRDTDPDRFGIVLDPAHCALDGEPESLAVDTAWPRLALVNLKNARYRETERDEHGARQWEVEWVGGTDGLCSWPLVARTLEARGYRGDLCLSAQYSEGDVEALAREDLRFARRLFGEAG